MILFISKLMLVGVSHKLDKLQNQSLREQKEWKAYRICGILFLVMTPVVVAIKTMGFGVALVSMLSLQTAAFALFGVASDASFEVFMNLISGSSVCILLFTIGLIMIIQSTKK